MGHRERIIEEKEKSAAACFMRFTQQKDKSGIKAVYYFIEGYEAPYYSRRIEILCKLEAIPIVCYGKKNVIKVYEKLSNGDYDKYKKCFFVDADFDDNSNLSKEIFVTPCHSIENLFVSEKVLCQILRNEFYILDFNPCFGKIISFFSEQIAQFNACVLEFNAWCSWAIKKEIKIDLGENFPKEFIELKIGCIKKKYSLKSIKDKYLKEHENINEKEIQDIMNDINSDSNKKLRGKYQKEFFIKFLNFIMEDDNRKKICDIKIKRKISINSNYFISQIAQYAETPAELEEYILKVITNAKF